MRLIRFHRIIHVSSKIEIKNLSKIRLCVYSVCVAHSWCMHVVPLPPYQWPSINLINFFHAIVFNEMARLIHNRRHIEPFCLTVVTLA